ncbi:unnamed protein product [Rhizophagus irregularis]|nr:unnamed protein product [Rhizophagus irregularis]
MFMILIKRQAGGAQNIIISAFLSRELTQPFMYSTDLTSLISKTFLLRPFPRLEELGSLCDLSPCEEQDIKHELGVRKTITDLKDYLHPQKNN